MCLSQIIYVTAIPSLFIVILLSSFFILFYVFTMQVLFLKLLLLLTHLQQILNQPKVSIIYFDWCSIYCCSQRSCASLLNVVVLLFCAVPSFVCLYLNLVVHYAGVVPETVAADDPSAAVNDPAQGEHHFC